MVGSGIAAARLSPSDLGLQLFENAFATALALAVLILIFGPVSGAHFNPVVTLADQWLHRRGDRRTAYQVSGYVAAQTAGAIGGTVAGEPDVRVATDCLVYYPPKCRTPVARRGGRDRRPCPAHLPLARTGRNALAPLSVGGYIGAAYWFTSSTSFANPAITIGRAFTDTFAGIAPTSLLGFIAAQLVGAAVGTAGIALFYPRRVTPLPATTEPAALAQTGAPQ